jgi:hypothetical protein
MRDCLCAALPKDNQGVEEGIITSVIAAIRKLEDRLLAETVVAETSKPQ